MTRSNKRGVSPLIATVLLMLIVVTIGAAVMLVLKGLTEENLEKAKDKADMVCDTNVDFEIVKINGYNQVCSGSGYFDIILRNKGNKDIVGFKYTVLGGQIYNNDTSIALGISEITNLNITYNPGSIGVVRQIMIYPIIKDIATNQESVCQNNEISVLSSTITNCPLVS
ncbi:MAG: archaellin/type IV pilin N-terminal domain-containing protein [archaeon]